MIPGWLPLLGAYILDGWVGDPPRLPHPVRGIGALITTLEPPLRRHARTPAALVAAGGLLVALVVGITATATWLLVTTAHAVHPWLGAAVTAASGMVLLARRSLANAVQAVHLPLSRGDLPAARRAAGEIVGRDTAELSVGEVARAAIETAAENTADGVVAPLFYALVGGLPLMAAYKAVNTLDSMLGHRNERYLYFGRVAARLDDLANWLPARLTALALCAAAALLRLDWRRSWSVLRADADKHPSPNSGWPESTMAGALGVRLGGTNRYGDLVSRRPLLNAGGRTPEPEDLPSGIRLLHTASHLFIAGGILIREVIGR